MIKNISLGFMVVEALLVFSHADSAQAGVELPIPGEPQHAAAARLSVNVAPAYSTGAFRNELFNGPNGERGSKLDWSDLQIAETQLGVRLDHERFFVHLRGSWGKSFGGKLDDEDYLDSGEASFLNDQFRAELAEFGDINDVPPEIRSEFPLKAGRKFSDATMKLKRGRKSGSVGRWSADVGFLRLDLRPNLRVWLTAGYSISNERYRAWGLTQVEGLRLENKTELDASEEVIRHDITMHGPRLGFEANWQIHPKWNLQARGAYAPWVSFKLEDSHFLRAPGGRQGADPLGSVPNFVDKTDNARQWEAGLKLSYAVTTRWSADIGMDVRGFDSGRAKAFVRDANTNAFEKNGTAKNRGSFTTLSLGATCRF